MLMNYFIMQTFIKYHLLKKIIIPTTGSVKTCKCSPTLPTHHPHSSQMFSSVKSGTCAVLTAFKTQAQNPSRREVHKLKHLRTWRVGSLAGCWQTKCNCAPRCSFRPPTTLLSSAQDSLELATVLTMHNAFVTFTSQCKPKGGKLVFQNNYLLENVIWCFSRGLLPVSALPPPSISPSSSTFS